MFGAELHAFKSDYAIEARLDLGGTGQTYKVRNLISDEFELLRRVPIHPGERGRALQNLLEVNIRLMKAGPHPNIAGFRGFLRLHDSSCILFEFLTAQSLGGYLRGRTLFVPEIARMARDILVALGHTHRHGVVHGSIRPDTVLITRERVLKLIDFGFDWADAGYQGMSTPSAQRDLRGAGNLLHQMLAHCSSHEPGRSGFPQELDHIASKALASNPMDRWQDAREMLAALQRCASVADGRLTR